MSGRGRAGRALGGLYFTGHLGSWGHQMAFTPLGAPTGFVEASPTLLHLLQPGNLGRGWGGSGDTVRDSCGPTKPGWARPGAGRWCTKGGDPSRGAGVRARRRWDAPTPAAAPLPGRGSEPPSSAAGRGGGMTPPPGAGTPRPGAGCGSLPGGRAPLSAPPQTSAGGGGGGGPAGASPGGAG